MTTGTVLAAVVMGLTAGWFASTYVKDGGRGRAWDILVGVAGGALGVMAISTFGGGANTGTVPLVTAAIMGAGIGLSLQRKFWPGAAPVVRRGRR